MPSIQVLNMQGKAAGEMNLSDEIFAVTPNVAAMHLVVRSILANKRQGTQSALTRGKVRGGGRKIYRQKGTGNARHHSRRAPQFTHGGMVFAPKPRDYSFCVPRKVKRLAMKSALTSKVQDGDLIVLDKLELAEVKTREVAKVLKALGATRKALILTQGVNESVKRAAANIPGVTVAFIERESSSLNVLDILNHDKFIATLDAVKVAEEVYE